MTMLILLMMPKVLTALSSQTREAAQRIAQGMSPIPPDYRTRWVGQLYEAQKEEALKALSAGWVIAATRVPNPTRDLSIEDVRIPVTGTGDEFSQNDNFAPALLARLFAFLLMAAKLSAETHAKRIEKEYAKWAGDVALDNTARAAKVFGKITDLDKNHTEVIATSSTVWASNEGAARRYEAEGVTLVRWWTQEDERVCVFCNDLHGTIISIDDYFVRPGQVLEVTVDGVVSSLKAPPWGMAHPPAHNRCRCTILPVIASVR